MKQDLFSRTHPIFKNKTKNRTFWETLLFQSHSTAKLIQLAISKKFKLFPKTYLFFLKSKDILNNLRKLRNSVAFHSKIATFSHSKVNSFFWRIHVFFITAKNLNVLRNVSVSVEFYCKLLPPTNFYNFKIFVWKTHFFSFKKAWSLNFLRTVTVSVDSRANLLPLPF